MKYIEISDRQFRTMTHSMWGSMILYVVLFYNTCRYVGSYDGYTCIIECRDI